VYRSTLRWDAERSCSAETRRDWGRDLAVGWDGRKNRIARRTGGVGRKGRGWQGSRQSCCRYFGAVASFLRSILMMIALRPAIEPSQEHSCLPFSRCWPRSEPPFAFPGSGCTSSLAHPSRYPALAARLGTTGTCGSGSWSVHGSVA